MPLDITYTNTFSAPKKLSLLYETLQDNPQGRREREIIGIDCSVVYFQKFILVKNRVRPRSYHHSSLTFFISLRSSNTNYFYELNSLNAFLQSTR